MDIPRQPTADTHGEEVAANDGRELQDAVTEQVAGEGSGNQLIDQAAGRDEKTEMKRTIATRARVNERKQR